MKLKAQVQRSYVRIGWVADDGTWEFGDDAGIYIDEDAADETLRASVTQGSIGSHSPERAIRRIEAYTKAADLAAGLNRCWDNDVAVDVAKFIHFMGLEVV